MACTRPRVTSSSADSTTESPSSNSCTTSPSATCSLPTVASLHGRSRTKRVSKDVLDPMCLEPAP